MHCFAPEHKQQKETCGCDPYMHKTDIQLAQMTTIAYHKQNKTESNQENPPQAHLHPESCDPCLFITE